MAGNHFLAKTKFNKKQLSLSWVQTGPADLRNSQSPFLEAVKSPLTVLPNAKSSWGPRTDLLKRPFTKDTREL
jgi:hypothetical protein